MMKNMKIVAVLLLLLVLVPSCAIEAAENGSFGAYLVGYVDSNPENTTLFQIINPTSRTLSVLLGYFDFAGNPLGCDRVELSANGMLQRPVSAEGRPDAKPPVAKANVVKIVSLDKAGGRPAKGIVGFQRHYDASRFWGSQRVSESNLAAIPEEILQENDRAEYKKIMGVCYP